jgi:hypothetical protein
MMPVKGETIMNSDKALRDLCKLATERVQDAANSVGQLLDNEEQALELLVNVIHSMTASAATLMHECMKKPDGTRPSSDECYAEILGILATHQGITATVMSLDEARERGL